MPDDTMGDLARQDIYPDERGFQPPVNPIDLPPEAYASLGGGDLGLLGSKGIAGLFNKPSWLQQAQDVTQKDVANYQTGGVPAVIGSLADTSGEQELAGGFGGNIKGVKPPIVPGALAALDQYHPPFYSAVERAVRDAKQNVAPGQQWAGYLRNQPGVKPEEVETLGLGKLFEQPTVSKDAVLGEIAANKVNVGEVVKGGGTMQKFGTPEEQAAALQRREDAKIRLMNTEVGSPDYAARAIEFTESERALRDIVPGWGRAEGSGEFAVGDNTKFSQYTLPGGENYRETLLTLPDKGQPSDWQVVEHPSGVGYSIRNSRGEYGLTPDGTRDAVFSTPDNARASIADYAATQSERPEFKSSHFDEPNILAHIRTNDRVIDGKKTLFVEEVQSDWHQAGKRKGYAEGEKPKVENFNDWAKANGYTEAEANAAWNKPENPIFATWDKINNEQVSQLQKHLSAVPDAPFKTTWPELAMKRVIRQAAEGGYDKVAWTPGSVQAERYDLSKHVDGIDVRPRTDAVTGDKSYSGLVRLNNGKVMSVGYGNNGIIDNVGASNMEMKGKHLSDVFGKDIAEKMMSGKSVFDADLKIGGEGMKGFYDEILPVTVNKLVKKHGGRVAGGRIVEENPKLTLDTVATDMGFGGWHSQLTAAQKEMVEARWEQRKKFGKETSVHTLDITPSLRAAAMKGFPLFTAGGIAATGMMGDLAKQDDYQ